MIGCGGRSSSRSPQPVRMKAFQASGTFGSCDSVLGCAVSGVVSSVTRPTLRRGIGPPATCGYASAMLQTRRNSIAFTVVVTVLVCLGALPILVIIALSGAPKSMVLATGAGRAAGGPAGGRLPVAGPLRARAEEAARVRPALGRLRRDRRGAAAAGAGRVLRRFHRGAEPGDRRPGDRGVQQGSLPDPAAVVAPGRARRDPRRARLRRDGRHRLRLRREHPLPRGRLQRHRRDGPRWHRGGDQRLHRALPVQPLRPPAVHLVHRHRRRHRRRLPESCRARAVSAGRLSSWP